MSQHVFNLPLKIIMSGTTPFLCMPETKLEKAHDSSDRACLMQALSSYL
jgi:hypothetical protein